MGRLFISNCNSKLDNVYKKTTLFSQNEKRASLNVFTTE